jgi:hypothetical protein
MGPIDEDQVRKLIESGALTATTKVWTSGMANWFELGQTDLAGFLISDTPTETVQLQGAGAAGPSQPHLVGPFHDTKKLTGWLRGLLWATIAFSVIGILSGMSEYSLLQDIKNGAFETEAEALIAANSNDSRQALIGIIQFFLFLGTAVVFLRWIYLSNANARAFVGDDMEFTSGWAVGWYFVPIMNLFKPYKAMQEIWKVSKHPGDPNWNEHEVPKYVSYWWTTWILAGVVGQLAFRMSLNAEELGSIINASLMTIATDVLEIPLCLLALKLIDDIHEMQATGYRRATHRPAPSPAPQQPVTAGPAGV